MKTTTVRCLLSAIALLGFAAIDCGKASGPGGTEPGGTGGSGAAPGGAAGTSATGGGGGSSTGGGAGVGSGTGGVAGAAGAGGTGGIAGAGGGGTGGAAGAARDGGAGAAGTGGIAGGAGGMPGASTPPGPAGVAELFLSTRAQNLRNMGTAPYVATSTRTRLTVDLANPRQEVLGFGASLTNSTAKVLAQLDPAKRLEIINLMYSPDQAHFTMTRLPMGAADFSDAAWTYAMTQTADLSNFTIQHDIDVPVVALVQDAQRAAGAANFKAVSSPWTAPNWMKSGGQYIGGSVLPQFYPLFAQYFVKYVQEYAKQGIKIWAVTPGNEPLHEGQFETMGWTIASEATFIANNLGPALRAANLDTKILGYDHNKGADLVAWTSGLAANATARSFIYGIANHWYEATVTANENSILQAHNAVPQFVQIATEQSIDTFGNGNPPLGTWFNVDAWWWTGKWGDWALATTGDHAPIEPVLRYAKDIIQTFNNWQAGWINWNAVLDQDGGPSHGARCQAPIHANTITKEVYITPTFYVMQHFSKYIVPGAKVVPTTGALPANVMAVSAINPDSTIATVILNWTTTPFNFALAAGAKTVEISSPAMSLQTIILR